MQATCKFVHFFHGWTSGTRFYHCEYFRADYSNAKSNIYQILMCLSPVRLNVGARTAKYQRVDRSNTFSNDKCNCCTISQTCRGCLFFFFVTLYTHVCMPVVLSNMRILHGVWVIARAKYFYGELVLNSVMR